MEDLTQEEVHFRTHADQNCIGFEAWHIARTADNLIHFAFERETTDLAAQTTCTRLGVCPRSTRAPAPSFDEVSSWVFPEGARRSPVT